MPGNSAFLATMLAEIADTRLPQRRNRRYTRPVKAKMISYLLNGRQHVGQKLRLCE